MKKIAKLSLVAAVAVAGLSTANAKPLEEAIKNVDVSGTVVYRYNDYQGAGENSNNYKVGVSLKSKVTDDVSFNSRVVIDDAFGGTPRVLATQTAGDANVDLELSQANFAYTGLANTTIIVGKQGLATPWTKAVDSDGGEQTGTGILAMSTFGPVTAAGGYFNQTNISDTQLGSLSNAGQNTMVAALIGSFGPVKAEAWYLDIDDTADSYFVKASGNVGPVGLFAQYSELDVDALPNNEYELLKVGVSAKVGMFGAKYTFAKTGDNGSSIVNAVATNSAIGWGFNLDGAADTTGHFVNVNAQVSPKLNIALNYNVADSDIAANDEQQEYYTQITYNHAKNLSAYVRLGNYQANGLAATNDQNRGRLQVEYKF